MTYGIETLHHFGLSTAIPPTLGSETPTHGLVALLILVRLDAVRIRPGPLSRARRAGPLPPTPDRPPAHVAVVAHLAARPEWTCTGCGAPWPCPVRRMRLLSEYADNRTALLIHLAGYLLDAASDLRHLTAEELYGRFSAGRAETRTDR